MAVAQQVRKGMATASRLGTIGLLRLALKHWYIISILFFLLPTIITSLQTGFQERDTPAEAIVFSATQLSLTLLNADSQIDKDVKILRKNPSELIGVKPENGIWKKSKYYWGIALIVWKISGNIFLISIPFVFAYRYFKWRGQKGVQTAIGTNVKNALLFGLGFIFVMNLILTIIGIVEGTLLLSFSEGLDIYKKVWLIILNTIPFHGLINLILYLAGV